MKFGFVGLGQMGAPMAINLAKHYDVTIFDKKKRYDGSGCKKRG